MFGRVFNVCEKLLLSLQARCCYSSLRLFIPFRDTYFLIVPRSAVGTENVSCMRYRLWNGIQKWNGIQRDNMNRKVESKVDTLDAASMHDLHVIQSPNVTRDAREKIALFAFHAFVVENSRFQQNRVRTKLKATLRLGLRAPFVARNKLNRNSCWSPKKTKELNQLGDHHY